MAGNNGGPWGGGGNRGGSNGGDDKDRQRPNGGRRPNEGQAPEIDQLFNKGRDRLRVLMGGDNGRTGNGGGGFGGGNSGGPKLTGATIGIGAVVAVLIWGAASFYTVRPEQQSVELFLGEFSDTGQPGLNFAPWPLITHEVRSVTTENTIDIGAQSTGEDTGLMLTGDENIVDIDFQVVWKIKDLPAFMFNLADPEATIAAVAESAMREIVAQSELAPILNTERGVIQTRLTEMVQSTLDSYDSGVDIVRINLDRVDPPQPVISSFFKVQDAEQERARLQNVADKYSNQVVAEARGQAAQDLEEAEAYRARVTNAAQGEASRFTSILAEYQASPDVTRRRMYLETMEELLQSVDLMILDQPEGQGQGVVPYLPLNELRSNSANRTTEQGGSN